MASMTDYLETVLVEHVLLNTAYTAPTTIYLALFTSPTSDAGDGTEVTGGSYARQPVTFAAWTAGTAFSDSDVTFAAMPSATVTHAALFDASTGGNMLMHGAMSSPKTVAAATDLIFPTGDINAAFT